MKHVWCCRLGILRVCCYNEHPQGEETHTHTGSEDGSALILMSAVTCDIISVESVSYGDSGSNCVWNL